MKLKNLSYLLIGVLIGSLIPIQSLVASSPIKLIINGQQIQCDVPPQNINGRVLVPARYVAENLNASVDWDGVNNAVIITSNQQNTPVKNAGDSNQGGGVVVPPVDVDISTNYPEAQHIKGNIKKVYINPTINYSSNNSKEVSNSQYEFDNGYFLMMYGKYSNMGNNFILLDGIYKAFPNIANDLKKDLNQMEVRTYQNKQYVCLINLYQFLRLHFKSIETIDIDDNSVAIIATNDDIAPNWAEHQPSKLIFPDEPKMN